MQKQIKPSFTVNIYIMHNPWVKNTLIFPLWLNNRFVFCYKVHVLLKNKVELPIFLWNSETFMRFDIVDRPWQLIVAMGIVYELFQPR